MLFVFLACFVFYVLSMIADSTVSVKGIKAGVAVEGNTWINALFGTNKETPKDYAVYDLIEAVGLSAAGIVALLHPAFHLGLYLSSGMYIGMGIKHIQGVLAWKKYGISL
jgi:hypothetical protein